MRRDYSSRRRPGISYETIAAEMRSEPDLLEALAKTKLPVSRRTTAYRFSMRNALQLLSETGRLIEEQKMAYTVEINTKGTGIPPRLYFNLSQPVYPASNIRTDVMLIQYFIYEYFTSSLAVGRDTTSEFQTIWFRLTSRGKRFDDGIYGPGTRRSATLWEQENMAPYKDGIFRPVPPMSISLLGSFDGFRKVNMMNIIWSSKYFGKSLSDQESIMRVTMNPLLVDELMAGPREKYDESI